MVKLKKIIKTINIGLLIVLLLLIININIHFLMAFTSNKDMIYKTNNMNIHNIYLEKEEDISNYLINFNCYECFSPLVLDYPCYNGENIKYDLIWTIKNPPFKQLGPNEYKLMCVFFDKGKRDKKDDTYSLEDLQYMSNGASNMYIFWLKKLIIRNEVKKNIQNIKQTIFNRLEIEFQKKIIAEMNEKLNLLKKEKKDFKFKFLVQQSEILQLQAEKKILENNLKLKMQEFLNSQKITEIEITNLKKEIKNIQTKLEIKNQANSNQNQKIEELKMKLNLLKIEIEKTKNEKNKYQYMTQSLEQKQNTFSGIFDLFYKKVFK
ncbi:hypothetical protein [Candidatus Phytoplasma fabacearum]|uniref:hypothetical protein n=1 Tax=Candidatus Phytoplasma fabacearum TaxID=2982628 RepID=UPI002712897C|nr:hypothetical protein ['Bituminaria bituminosa' little leaf phytoplasma]MDO8024016.1 hypothetical protein ['Bituminaria bituminosa' little leaf phytoplasma]